MAYTLWQKNGGKIVLLTLRNIKNLNQRIIALITGIAFFVVGFSLSSVNQLISGGILVIGAFFEFFYITYKIAERNFLDLNALFSAIWLGTVGLSQLRLLNYQKIWETRTMINIVLAFIIVQISLPVGALLGDYIANRFKDKKELKLGKILFKFKKERLFWICTITTAIAIILFVWNIAIKGYVPFFSNIFNAYIYFYTKRMIFVTAACAVSPVAYWCIKKCELGIFKKILLYICIAINTFIIPTLQVNRGVFIVAALMLTASIFFLNGKKFIVFILCLVVTFTFYEIASVARNYTGEYLTSVFEPSDIPLDNDKTETETETETEDDTTENNPTENDGTDTNSGLSFKLSPKAAFLYGYFTVSHDNFNEAVINATEYTYGVRQLFPFNSVLRSSAITQAISDSEIHFVKPGLNTYNLICGIYYDLREFGVTLFCFIWSVIIGAIEKFYLRKKGCFALAALGNAITVPILSFFSPMFENFTFWMFWGTIGIFMVISSIKILPKNNKE